MKTFGDLKALKEGIKKMYAQEIERVQEAQEAEVAALEEKCRVRMAESRRTAQGRIARDERISYDTSFNETMASVVREHELFIEGLAEEVFAAILSDAERVCARDEFIALVAASIKEVAPGSRSHATVRCIPSAAKAITARTGVKATPDKTVKGALIEVDGTTYDLTLQTLLDTKRDSLRKGIVEALG